MIGKLIVVSNRIPKEDVPSGGLVVALHDVLRKVGGMWVGAHPEPADAEHAPLASIGSADGYRKFGLPMTEKERAGHYLGHSNSVLWPLCHRRTDLIDLSASDAKIYRDVNIRMARALADMVEPDDLIWIHDYHFLPLGDALRELGVTARIGFFLHIPFPVPSDLPVLPREDAFARWVAAYDLVGLQTRADVARCLEMFRAHSEAEVFWDGRVKMGRQLCAVRSFPIGIDAESFARDARDGDQAGVDDDASLANLSPHGPLLIGAERLDYSKGLPNRVRAFAAYLDRRPKNGPRPTFLQIAPPSREDVEAYRDIRDQLESLAGQVNGRHSQLGWTPVRYIHRGYPRATLAKLFRAARVGLVTPMVDGMNLVAKEYVAAQDPDDPGVLILSRTAGAAEQMDAALLVNPYNVDLMADAIEQALSMPLDERRARHASLAETVFRDTVQKWSDDFLAVLQRQDGALQARHGQTSTDAAAKDLSAAASTTPLEASEIIH